MSEKPSRRSVVASIFAGTGLGAFAPAEALAQSKGNNAPITPKEKLRHYEAGNVSGETAMDVSEDSHQRRDRRPGRADHRRPRAHLPDGGERD